MKAKTRAIDDALVDDSCVLCLPLDEGNGTIAYDRSRFGNHGTIYGASWVDGKYGKALSFDGVDDYISYPELPINENSNLTVCVWFKLKSDGIDTWNSQPIITLGTAGFHLHVRLNTNRVVFRWDPGVKASPYYELGQGDRNWHFACAWHRVIGDTHYLGLYVDGQFKGENAYIFTEPPSNKYWKIGTLSNVYFDGLIDEVRIYNRALNQSEIQRIMNSPYHAKFFPPYRLKVKV